MPCVKAFNSRELPIIHRMIEQKINSPLTSSMGRLFDGIASIIGLCHRSSFEGQAAMALEYQVSDEFILTPYYYEIVHEDHKNKIRSVDWSGIIKGVIEDLRAGRGSAYISTRFHLTLIEIIVDIARQVNKSDIVFHDLSF